ncbi:MAG: carboxylesterase [Gammaproteobacteria bacterium]|nr:carboxylesterase [Gammaproteobacteria bacterium]
MSEANPPIIVETGPEPDASIIWLHGLGADGNDFVPVVPDLGLDQAPGVRLVFPHAPRRPVTVNMGSVMRAWFDIFALDRFLHEDEEGIHASARYLAELVDAERAAGIPSRRIVLAGFSQGGAMALFEGLRYPHPLAGILALSTYLPLAGSLGEELHAANRETPILFMHGQFDPVIPYFVGTTAVEQLRAQGLEVEFRAYPMAHQVVPEQIQAIGVWLRERLAR